MAPRKPNANATDQTKKVRSSAPLWAALVLGACALSPQVVRIHPELAAPALPSGSSAKSIALQVSDARGTALVGRRGGVYQTATITTDPGMADMVRNELARILSARGFQMLEAGVAADIRLTVEIAELGYEVKQQKVTRMIETSASVRARSASGETERTGEYADRRTKEVVKAPSAADNEELINAVLSASLQRLVADPDLLNYD